MPTVSAPSSRAIWATIGAAPVPVPPPAPAAMNTMSEPRSMALMRSYSSRAAWRPSSGFDPDPRPRVMRSPMCSVWSAADCCRDCRSVLMAMNSTPAISASTMRLTALTPAPPTPTTRSTGVPTAGAGAKLSAMRSGRAYTSWTGGCGARGAGARSSTLSGMSDENALRRRSWGDGTCRLTGASRGEGSRSEGCGCGRRSGSGSGSAAGLCVSADGAPSPSGASSSAVLRNRAASGPSRMLARLPVGI